VERGLASCHTLKYHHRITSTTAPNPLTDFEALAFFTADHAAVESGKAYVSGGFWDQLNLPEYPAQVSISLVAVIRVPSRAYLEDHQITVSMIDADDNPLPLRIDGNLRVGASPSLKPGDPTIVPMAFPLNGMTIEHAGNYWFVLSIDGEEKARYRIRAVQVGPVPPPMSEAHGSESGEEE
jgi:hypothetical protein